MTLEYFRKILKESKDELVRENARKKIFEILKEKENEIKKL